MDDNYIQPDEPDSVSTSKRTLVASQTNNSVIVTDHHG